MSSVEKDSGRGKMNGGEKVALGLVIARRDRSELLELGNKVLDEVPRLIEVTVVGTRRLRRGGRTAVFPVACKGANTRASAS